MSRHERPGTPAGSRGGRDTPGDEASLGDDTPSVVRHEEELHVDTTARPAGSVRARKRVESHEYEEVVPRSVEHADVERVVPAEHDSGEIETLPDGSVSIPVFEEEIVVTRRMVVRERIIIRKHTVTEEHKIEADLRRERVEVEADAGVESRVDKSALAADPDAGSSPGRGEGRQRGAHRGRAQ